MPAHQHHHAHALIWGYELESFKDAFKRYIFIHFPEPHIPSVTTGQSNNIKELNVKQSVTDNNGVTDKTQYNILNLKDCHDVTDENGGSEENKEKEPISSVTKYEELTVEF